MPPIQTGMAPMLPARSLVTATLPCLDMLSGAQLRRPGLVLQSVLDISGGLGGLPNDLNDLFQTPYDDDGARVHTNSWGSIIGDGS